MRRMKPNLVAQAKVFQEHGYLLLAEPLANYEAERQSNLETGIYKDYNSVAVFLKLAKPLSCLIDFPDGTKDDEYNAFVHSNKVFELTEVLTDIDAYYRMLKRSVDFPTLKTKELRALLTEPKGTIGEYAFLTREQETHFRTLVSDVDHWVERPDTPEVNLPRLYLEIHDELCETGTLSTEGSEKLRYLISLQAAVKRPRLYADSALIMMLAEVFEDKNKFGNRASLRPDPKQGSKKSHEYQREQMRLETGFEGRPFKAVYNSPFSRFVEAFFEVFDVKGIGLPSVEKITKNRKKIRRNKVLHLLENAPGESNISKLFQILDMVKA